MDEMENLREIPMEERKCLANQILLSVTRFMEKHNLKYWLAYGTLLGAVRHGGYIPWDDDIDVCVPRKDYFEFIELWEKYPEDHCANYEIISPYLTEGYIHKRLKVADNRTIMKEYTEIKHAAFIDLFPVDGYKDEDDFRNNLKRVQKLQSMYDLLHSQKVHYKSTVKKMAAKFILSFYNLTGRKRKLDKIKKELLTRFDFEKSKCCAYAEVAKIAKGPWRTEWVVPFEKISFENNEYNRPCNYDRILEKSYGDYMTPPPEGKRGAHQWYNMYWREEVSDEEIEKIINGWKSCAK